MDAIANLDGIQTIAVHQKMQVRLNREWRGFVRASSFQQPTPDRIHRRAAVSTGAHGACGGSSQPLLVLRNSQRLPSSR